MSKLLSRHVTATVDGSFPAGLTDCNLSLTLELASSQTKKDKSPVDEPIRVTWEVTLSGVTGRENAGDVSIGSFKTAAKAGAKLAVEYFIGSLAKYVGKAMVSSYNESAPVGDKITYSVTLRGVSALTKEGEVEELSVTGEEAAAYNPETETTNEEE